MISWNDATIELVRSNRGMWRPNRHLSPNWFESRVIDFDLWFIYAGRGWIRRGSDCFEVRPGCFVCFRPGFEYEGWQDESDRLGVAFVHFNFLDGRGRILGPEEVEGPAFYFDEQPSVLLEQLMQRIITLYRGAMADASKGPMFLSMASRLLGALLGELEFRRALSGAAAENPPERRYRVVDRFLECLQGDNRQRLTVAGVAAKLGFSTDHFIRLIKRETGRTPKTIMLEMRMNEAKHLLERTSLNVSEIAYELGYEDVFSFSQQFKAKAGVSPTVHREGRNTVDPPRSESKKNKN